MKIQHKKGAIYIQTSDAKILLGNQIKAKAEDADVFVARTIELTTTGAAPLLVDRPGEFEVHGVMVQAIPMPGTSEIFMFSIDSDGVNLVFVADPSLKATKKMIDQVGVNNVLFVNLVPDVEKVKDIVEELDPNVLVPVSASTETIESLAKRLGAVVPLAEKTLNVTEDSFDAGDEEKPLQLFILE